MYLHTAGVISRRITATSHQQRGLSLAPSSRETQSVFFRPPVCHIASVAQPFFDQAFPCSLCRPPKDLGASSSLIARPFPTRDCFTDLLLLLITDQRPATQCCPNAAGCMPSVRLPEPEPRITVSHGHPRELLLASAVANVIIVDRIPKETIYWENTSSTSCLSHTPGDTRKPARYTYWSRVASPLRCVGTLTNRGAASHAPVPS